ncbi:LysR family transcriptional regulator [Mesorhizobium sp. NBSH29]|uniref:LysR family transcriptional regulator n=1 Tax=Mesorhizobium sp. NBSH29 TaxID=2654249 RepID=UPI0018966C14|nr:LysR family transcriptional regulator [Mesorhizobium sp. NBSH29]QPC85775.1 LysR family transcriptional regulator [Mesorhizobium sp. NBSH29]
MTTPPLNALRAFEAVARLGSFRAAAEALYVTQSAVSHQIRNVEEWLGRPLFEREGNRTRLLPHGADLARSLAGSLTEIEAACNRARNISQALVIAAIPSVAMCWLIPRLSRFLTAHPEIEIRIVYAMHGREINFHDVHLAFVFAKQPPSGPIIETHFYLAGQSVPVCSPSRLAHLGHTPETVADFLALGLLHDGTPTGWKTWLSGVTDPAATASLDGTTFEDFNLLRAAALSGQGVALCPKAMIQPDIESGGLVQISQRIQDDGYNYYLLCSTAAPPCISRHAQVFRDWAMAERDEA